MQTPVAHFFLIQVLPNQGLKNPVSVKVPAPLHPLQNSNQINQAETLVKGELRGLCRLGEATRQAGAPRISHWGASITPGPEEMG